LPETHEPHRAHDPRDPSAQPSRNSPGAQLALPVQGVHAAAASSGWYVPPAHSAQLALELSPDPD
jgi:hypothetical protein